MKKKTSCCFRPLSLPPLQGLRFLFGCVRKKTKNERPMLASLSTPVVTQVIEKVVCKPGGVWQDKIQELKKRASREKRFFFFFFFFFFGGGGGDVKNRFFLPPPARSTTLQIFLFFLFFVRFLFVYSWEGVWRGGGVVETIKEVFFFDLQIFHFFPPSHAFVFFLFGLKKLIGWTKWVALICFFFCLLIWFESFCLICCLWLLFALFYVFSKKKESWRRRCLRRRLRSRR